MISEEQMAESMESIIGKAERMAIRRMRICKHAPCCPDCKTKQVQLINSGPLAGWKCRICKRTWRHEPLIEE